MIYGAEVVTLHLTQRGPDSWWIAETLAYMVVMYALVRLAIWAVKARSR